jgi:hypothetical protein
MKKLTITTVQFAAIILAMVVFQFCGTNEPASSQKVEELLTGGTWTIKNVSVDNQDQTNLFTGLKITFTKNGFIAINGGLVWPSKGTWRFVDESSMMVARGDGVLIEILDISQTRLLVSMNWSETILAGGRKHAIAGKHVFEMIK